METNVWFSYVLTERFMQDVIEDYFGHQRTQRGRSDKPSAQQFSYNDMTIVAKRDIAPPKWYTVSDKPVEKRKTKK